MKITAITQHAIDRYLERSGSNKAVRAMNKVFAASDAAVSIGRNRYYAKGWIYVIKRGVVKTAYKPRTQEQMNAIHNALNND